jgi:hypothetical protein
MFPNVRLQIVALFVSVLALSFGFGMFAAFRVNHEPLAQIRASAAPLQLAPENAVPPSTITSWGAPFGSRFWLSETQIRGAGDLPPLTPVVRHDVTGRTITWIVVTGSVVSAPALQPPSALPGVHSAEVLLAPKQGETPEQAAPPAEGIGPAAAPAAVVGAAESATQAEPETTNAVPDHAAQEPEPREVHVSAPRKAARATTPRRRVATRAPVTPQVRVQTAGQRQEPVVFQSAPPPYRPQKGSPVTAPYGSQSSTSDVPVFQTAPPSQR